MTHSIVRAFLVVALSSVAVHAKAERHRGQPDDVEARLGAEWGTEGRVGKAIVLRRGATMVIKNAKTGAVSEQAFHNLTPAGHGTMRGSLGASDFIVDTNGTVLAGGLGARLTPLQGTTLVLERSGMGERRVFDLRSKEFLKVRYGEGRGFKAHTVRTGSGNFDFAVHTAVHTADGRSRRFDENGKRVAKPRAANAALR